MTVLLNVALAAFVMAPPIPTGDADTPRVFRLRPETLRETKRRVREHDASLDTPGGGPLSERRASLQPALDRLGADARKALAAGPFSVVNKTVTPPSGDKHDYMSQAPYFWPNPKTPDGLPYVRKDGERNPEIRKITDHDTLAELVSTTETLALAYYFLDDDVSAARAAQLIRAWFLDPPTRMNPHLEYGQGIPGVSAGRGIGIIETRGLARLVDAVGLLAGSKAWTPADQQGLEAWFKDYLRWLRESGHGREEAAARNNHGTCYDVQVASFALFTGQRELATQVLVESRQKRIAVQIDPDGTQPLELARTRGWSYSVMNLEGLFELAALADAAGLDLWNYRTQDGRGIRRALDWLLPYAHDEPWPYLQITDWSGKDLGPLLREAAVRYGEPRYEELATRLSAIPADDRLQLIQPQSRKNSR